MNILHINSSARSQAGYSSQIAQGLSERLRQQHPEAHFVLRDLARQAPAILDEAALNALYTPAAQRSAAQAARVAEDDALIAEVQAADVLVIGVPMYNFGLSAQLKNWLDAIARAGVSFRYTANGPEGLLTGKTVYLALARGGYYRDTEHDTQLPQLQQVLRFLGMTTIHCVFAEGLNMGDAAAAAGLAQAQAEIDALFA